MEKPLARPGYFFRSLGDSFECPITFVGAAYVAVLLIDHSTGSPPFEERLLRYSPPSPAISCTRLTIRERTAGRVICVNALISLSPSSLETKSLT
jgi:hypothetical protein